MQNIYFTDKIRRNIIKKNLLNSQVLKKPTGKEDTLCRRDVQQQAKTFTSRCFLTSQCGRCFKAEFIASIRLDTSSQKGFLLRNLNPKINVKSSLELMVILLSYTGNTKAMTNHVQEVPGSETVKISVEALKHGHKGDEKVILLTEAYADLDLNTIRIWF